MQLPKIDFQITFFCDSQCVGNGRGYLLEQFGHFLGTAEVELFGHVRHAFGIVEVGLGADTDQRIVRMRVLFLDVMDIVGSHHLKIEFLGPLDQVAIDQLLLWNTVIL